MPLFLPVMVGTGAFLPVMSGQCIKSDTDISYFISVIFLTALLTKLGNDVAKSFNYSVKRIQFNE